jgi:hypothetical protein
MASVVVLVLLVLLLLVAAQMASHIQASQGRRGAIVRASVRTSGVRSAVVLLLLLFPTGQSQLVNGKVIIFGTQIRT